VRTARFIARKQWVICGADDMLIRVYNYNTMEKVAEFEAHQGTYTLLIGFFYLTVFYPTTRLLRSSVTLPGQPLLSRLSLQTTSVAWPCTRRSRS
jgi:hypothetical protein